MKFAAVFAAASAAIVRAAPADEGCSAALELLKPLEPLCPEIVAFCTSDMNAAFANDGAMANDGHSSNDSMLGEMMGELEGMANSGSEGEGLLANADFAAAHTALANLAAANEGFFANLGLDLGNVAGVHSDLCTFLTTCGACATTGGDMANAGSMDGAGHMDHSGEDHSHDHGSDGDMDGDEAGDMDSDGDGTATTTMAEAEPTPTGN